MDILEHIYYACLISCIYSGIALYITHRFFDTKELDERTRELRQMVKEIEEKIEGKTDENRR